MRTPRVVSRIALSAVLAVGIAGAGFIAAPAPVLAAAKGQTVSPAVGKPLQEAQNLMKAGKIKEAIVEAKKAADMEKKTPFETYMANEILGGLYIKAQDYPNATKALEASLDSGQMPPEDKTQRLKMLTQIYYQSKNYTKALDMAGQYLKESPGDADTQILVAQSHYLLKDYKKASDALRAIVKGADGAGKPVKEDTLQLLMASDFEQKNDAGVQSTLELLVARYPKPQYMKDLISMNERNLRGGSTKTNLDVYVVKFNAGVFTTAKEYTEMTELSLQDGLPGLAKKVMEKGTATGVLGQADTKEREARLLNMATTQADADLKALEKGVAEAQKQKTGEALIKFGEAYWSYGMHDKAVATIEAGIAKGVPNMDDAKLRLGIAYHAAGKRPQAMEAFRGIAPGSVPAQLASLWKLMK